MHGFCNVRLVAYKALFLVSCGHVTHAYIHFFRKIIVSNDLVSLVIMRPHPTTRPPKPRTEPSVDPPSVGEVRSQSDWDPVQTGPNSAVPVPV